MKKITVLLAAILCVVLLAGCKQTVIEGTWKDDSGTTYVFNKDMTFSININAETSVGGKFSIPKGSNQITFTMGAPSGQIITSTATFTLDTQNKKLTIVGSDGATTLLHQ